MTLSSSLADLFHRAVSQSGTALSPWAHVTANTARQRAHKLAQLAGCKKIDTSQEVLKCLRKIPAKELVELSPRILVQCSFSLICCLPFSETTALTEMANIASSVFSSVMKRVLKWKIIISKLYGMLEYQLRHKKKCVLMTTWPKCKLLWRS